MNRRGFTLLEMLITTAISAIVVLGIALTLKAPIAHFMRLRMNSQMELEARMCMDTITHYLRGGMANTVVISTPVTNPIIPHSQISYQYPVGQPNGDTSCTIFVESAVAYMQCAPLNVKRVLAHNVSSLTFTGDPNDPGLVTVDLILQAPYDSSGDSTHIFVLHPPAQLVRLLPGQ